MLVLLVDTRIKSTLWKLNSSILNNRATKEKLNIGIKSYLEHNDNEEVMPSVLWDALKVVIRGKMNKKRTFRMYFINLINFIILIYF